MTLAYYKVEPVYVGAKAPTTPISVYEIGSGELLHVSGGPCMGLSVKAVKALEGGALTIGANAQRDLLDAKDVFLEIDAVAAEATDENWSEVRDLIRQLARVAAGLPMLED